MIKDYAKREELDDLRKEMYKLNAQSVSVNKAFGKGKANREQLNAAHQRITDLEQRVKELEAKL